MTERTSYRAALGVILFGRSIPEGAHIERVVTALDGLRQKL